MINDRAREILAYIQKFQSENGSAPTIREIGQQFSIRSTNGVRYYLNLLDKSGQISRSKKLSRGIRTTAARTPRLLRPSFAGIPILGRVAAGEPILAEENHDGTLELSDMFGGTDNIFALQVRGDSMIDAGILPGDYIIVHKQETARAGEIIVALVGEDEATAKYYHPRKTHIELIAANAKYAPIVVEPGTPFQIVGTVRGVMRTLAGR